MPTCADIVLPARYNAGMNRKLYEAAARLPPAELGPSLGRARRLLRQPARHHQPFAGGDTIWPQRTRLDAMIVGLGAELKPSDLEQALAYRNSRGQALHTHFGSVLLHLFNHQTHHRGQASTLLTQAGADIGVTDLLELIADLA